MATPFKRGQKELKDAMATGRSLFMSVGIFSVFVNLLMLTGPLFMLQVYDRVLGSRSEATLVALFALVGFLYLCCADGTRAPRIGLARSGICAAFVVITCFVCCV